MECIKFKVHFYNWNFFILIYHSLQNKSHYNYPRANQQRLIFSWIKTKFGIKNRILGWAILNTHIADDSAPPIPPTHTQTYTHTDRRTQTDAHRHISILSSTFAQCIPAPSPSSSHPWLSSPPPPPSPSEEPNPLSLLPFLSRVPFFQPLITHSLSFSLCFSLRLILTPRGEGT